MNKKSPNQERYRNLIIGQSGGPTAVINASLYGVIKEALKTNQYNHLYGAIYGLDGIINENFIDFNDYLDKLENLKTTPSAFLGSVRFKLDKDFNDPNYLKILKVFEKYQITDFFYIGGNDSMETCLKINNYFKTVHFNCNVIGIPKTIDNDLCDTYFSPGYPSAAKYIINSLIAVYQDVSVYEEGRVTIIEVMGRDAGWLAASASITKYANCPIDLIYLPEETFHIEDFLIKVNKIYQTKKKVLIVVSEGIKDEYGNYLLISRDFNKLDAFGHLQLGGVGMVLAEIVNRRLNLNIRSIELNILQRCSMEHASLRDLQYAIKVGRKALKLALLGYSGYMVKIIQKNKRMALDKTPLEKVATLVKPFPKSWIKNNQISQEFDNYLLPLIQGDVKIFKELGLSKYLQLNKHQNEV